MRGTSKEQRVERYCSEGILPDPNPSFVEKLEEVFHKYFPHFYGRFLRLLTDESDLLEGIVKKLNRFSDDCKMYEKIVREHADADSKEQMLGNADRVLADVRKLIGEARELDKTVRDRLHEYKERKKMQEDQKVMASFIWDLRHTVEQEVKRRIASKLPLSPDKRPGAPSYRKRWKLVSDVLNYWFRYKNGVGNLIPYSETAVRKFANRYKDHPSDSPS